MISYNYETDERKLQDLSLTKAFQRSSFIIKQVEHKFMKYFSIRSSNIL